MSARERVSTGVSVRERIVGLWLLTHPGPSLVTALAYAVFALLAAHGRPDSTRLLVTVVGMVGLQFAISALNDYCDREADALSDKNKPLARGALPPWVALVATALFSVVMIACYAPYGLAPLLIAGGFLALGFAYDLGLKSTPLGGVLMGLAFPLLPLLAWDLFASVKPALFWTFPLGLALGLAIHLADALPDAAADGAAGAHGLTQALGHHALAACWLLLAAANALVIVLAVSDLAPVRPLVLYIAEPIAFAGVLAAVIVARQTHWPERQRLRLNFILTVSVALVTALGWLISAVL
ncbi:MAG TPA: UbiA family prenyltransferase [Ktedonobacterales bacterium]|nr:UbiA family prenyltransferase [Ktedonobacterales bacterium]